MTFLVMIENGLIRKLRKQRNQSMKFGELLGCNMKKFFLEKSYTKGCAKLVLDPFMKKSKLGISLELEFEMLYCMFLLFVQVEVYQIY